MEKLIAASGIIALIFPAEALWRKKLQNVSIYDVMQRVRFRYAWLHWVNFMDFAKGWGGVCMIKSVAGKMIPQVSSEVFLLVSVGLSVSAGLTVKQCFFSREETDLLAPCAYLGGLTLALVPTLVGLLVLATGTVVAMGLGSLVAGFLVAGLMAEGLGVIAKVSPWSAACAALLLLSPALCAVMLQRRLVLAVRPSRGTKNAPLREIPVERRASVRES